MRACSIHVTTSASSCTVTICCSGSLGHRWAQLGALAAKLLVCTEGFRANPTSRRGPGSSSSPSLGRPPSWPWRERVAAASPGLLCRLPAVCYHCARGWAHLRGQGLGPDRVLQVIQRLLWLGAGIKPLPPSWKAPLTSPQTSRLRERSCFEQLIGAGFILFCFCQNVQQNFFLYI